MRTPGEVGQSDLAHSSSTIESVCIHLKQVLKLGIHCLLMQYKRIFVLSDTFSANIYF